MPVLEGAVDGTFSAFRTDGVDAPAGPDPLGMRATCRHHLRVGETRIHAETGTFEIRTA